jgi:Flp pilus assembly protein TadG
VVGVSFVVLCLIGGMAVDLSRILVAQNRLQHALDAAGLAIGATTTDPTNQEGNCDSNPSDYLPSLGQKYLNANFDVSLGAADPITVCESTDGTKFVVYSKVTVPLYFMDIIGYVNAYPAATSHINRSVSGLEVAMVLDNSGSMGEQAGSTTAIQGLKNASQLLVNELWNQSNSTTAQSPAPAAANALYFGIAPFSASVNPFNTNTNATAGTTAYEILGSDANVKVSDILVTTNGNTSASSVTGSTTNLYCAYNGWTPAANDYINPNDLIHLAQDLCAQGISITSTGTVSFNSSYASIYLVDTLNSSTKYAWKGCVEGRATTGDTAAGGYYWDNKISSATVPNQYDHEMDTADISAGTAPTAEHLWHIFRPTRNKAYTATHFLPTYSSYYASNYAFTPSYTLSGGKYTYIRTYSWPSLQAVLSCPVSSGTSTSCTQTATWSAVPTYYWGAPNSNSNSGCISTMLPLTNDYTSISTEIGLMGQHDTTITDSGVAWGARLLSGLPPFPEAASVESSLPGGFAIWRRALIIMTDGQPNLGGGTPPPIVYYSVYGQNESSGTNPWTQNALLSGTPILAELENNSSTINASLTPAPGISGNTSCNFGDSGTNGLTQGQNTVDQYQIMCRIYSVCKALRSQNYYIYTVLFNHDGFSPGDEQTLLQQCTADGKGNVDATNKFFTATDTTTLATAFQSIAAQLANLRVSH